MPLMPLVLLALAAAPLSQSRDVDPIANHLIPMAAATKGLRGAATAPLQAKIDIEQGGKPLGTLTCTLADKQAPNTVANFVGLARGVRLFFDGKAWVKKPFYDGLTFHRALAGFLIMGGDLAGTGTGDAGYTFDDEISPDLKMDKGGLLVMANHGPNTNSAQFMITEKEAPWLTGKHTIFGQCDPVTLVAQISATPTGLHEIPRTPVIIKKVTISRGAAAPKKIEKPEKTEKAAKDQ